MSSAEIRKDRERLLEIITKKAYVKGKITLSSGKISDYYIDARVITLEPEGAYLSAKIILDIVKDDDYDAIGGPTLGADPFVGALGVVSFQQDRPRNNFIIRKAAKAHGKQKQVEGPLLQKGAKVVLVDDVATTGKAFLESIDVLKGMDIEIVKAVCLVDRGEGAKEAVAAKGVELVSVFDIGEIHK